MPDTDDPTVDRDDVNDALARLGSELGTVFTDDHLNEFTHLVADILDAAALAYRLEAEAHDNATTEAADRAFAHVDALLTRGDSVLVSGDPFDGMTVYGPAVRGRLVNDLDRDERDWWIVPLRPLSEFFTP